MLYIMNMLMLYRIFVCMLRRTNVLKLYRKIVLIFDAIAVSKGILAIGYIMIIQIIYVLIVMILFQRRHVWSVRSAT